jgi:hypothetical protein
MYLFTDRDEDFYIYFCFWFYFLRRRLGIGRLVEVLGSSFDHGPTHQQQAQRHAKGKPEFNYSTQKKSSLAL